MDKTITELKTAIEKLTGKTPRSNDPDYLERQLAKSRKRKADGAKAIDRYSESTTVMSVSMPGAAKDAAIRIAGGEHLGISELVRRALAEFGARHGYPAEAKLIEGDS